MACVAGDFEIEWKKLAAGAETTSNKPKHFWSFLKKC